MSLPADLPKQIDFRCEALWCSDTRMHRSGERCALVASLHFSHDGIAMRVCEYHARQITKILMVKGIESIEFRPLDGTWVESEESEAESGDAVRDRAVRYPPLRSHARRTKLQQGDLEFKLEG